MIQINTEVRKWGNSLAVVLPKDKIKGTNIKEGKKITLLIPSGDVDLRKKFGSMKNIFKRPTEEIMREIDEGWDE